MEIGRVFQDQESRQYYKVIGYDPTPSHPSAGHPNWRVLVVAYNPTEKECSGQPIEYLSKVQ